MIDRKRKIPDVFLERGDSEGNMSSHCSRAVAHTRRETVKGLFISLLIIPRRCRHLAPCGLSFCRHRHQGEDNRVSPGPGVRLPPPVARPAPPPLYRFHAGQNRPLACVYTRPANRASGPPLIGPAV